MGRGSRKTQHYRDAADIALCKVLLRHNTCRAVVYRGHGSGRLSALYIDCLGFLGLSSVRREAFREPRPTQASWLLDSGS